MHLELEDIINDHQNSMSLLTRKRYTSSSDHKSDIERQLHMYDQLWEESPRIKQERAKSRAEGELQAAQTMFVNIVSARYPGLTELAKQQAAQPNSPNTLNKLALKVVTKREMDPVARL